MAETIIIIGVIVEVITLIVFFVMVSNVASIKKSLCNTSAEEYMRMAGEEEFIGNKTKAKECLLRAKYKFSFCEGEAWKGVEYEGEEYESTEEIIAVLDKKISSL